MSAAVELDRVKTDPLRQYLDAMTHPTRAGLREGPARTYLVGLIRWALGDRSSPPIGSGVDYETRRFITGRAAELLDEHHRELPPVVNPLAA